MDADGQPGTLEKEMDEGQGYVGQFGIHNGLQDLLFALK